MTSTSSATNAASSSARPEVGGIFTGKVVSILKDKLKKDALPHGLILAFGSTSGMLRARDLNGDAMTQRDTLKSVRRGDSFTFIVFNITGTALEPKYELSESLATKLLEARKLIGETLKGQVTNVQPFGAFVSLGDGRSGLLHVSEMGSTNQQVRRSQLANKIGTQVDVNVLSVEIDPINPTRLHFELSEVEAELKKAAQLAGRRITAIILGPCNDGLKLGLKNGVEIVLPFENFGSLDYQNLKVRNSLDVKVLGVVGRALLVTYEK